MADNAFDILVRTIDDHQGSLEQSPYYAFEPWDITEPRPEWQIKMAREYGVDLLSEENIKTFGICAPANFQSGIIYDDVRLQVTSAGNQSGKSIARIIRQLCQITGEYPYALRYDKGVDTGIPRKITKENISRWGRRDAITHEVIDHDTTKLQEYLNGSREWDCGNIIGTGKFPESLRAPEGEKFWVGTTQKAYTEMWKPTLWLEDKKCIVPAHFIDKKRGNHGYHSQDRLIYFTGGRVMSIITYETGAVGFEAARLFQIDFDEEPPKHEIFSTAMVRCQRASVTTTPYLGITWLKGVMEYEPESKDPNYKRVYHCTQFDSPYKDTQSVLDDIGLHPPHEVPARVFGIPIAKSKGQPIFDVMKVNLWMQKFKPKYHLARFSPKSRYHGIVPDPDTHLPCLMETDIEMETQRESRDKIYDKTNQYDWRIYEDVEDGEAYALIADPAEGDEIPENAGDFSSGMIIKKPKDKDEFPKPVAVIRSTLLVEQFAEICLYAARYYNNATLAPESKNRGSWNMAFYMKTKDYPHWYYHETERWSTRKRRGTPGFDTNSKTRDLIFKKVQDWEDAFDEETAPTCVDDILLKEMAGCIRNKNGKPDHDTGGSTDLLVCWGIGLFVLTEFPSQFRCNHVKRDEEETFLSRFVNKPEAEGFFQFPQYRD